MRWPGVLHTRRASSKSSRAQVIQGSRMSGCAFQRQKVFPATRRLRKFTASTSRWSAPKLRWLPGSSTSFVVAGYELLVRRGLQRS